MKKLLFVFVVAGLATFTACGPSKEQKAEKARQDSIALADSLAKEAAIQTRLADSTAKVAAEAAHADSIAKGLDKVKVKKEEVKKVKK